MEYEYLVINREMNSNNVDPINEEELDRQGKAGWELITVIPLPMSERTSPKLQYIFKREKQ